MSTAPAQLDRAKMNAFGERLLASLNGAAVALAIELGRRTGLFEAMSGAPPSSAADIAKRAKLQERHVREWLGGAACGGLVEYDVARQTFFFPPEHAVLLTGSSTQNMASAAAYFPELGRILPELVDAFKNGGGVPYSKYFPGFSDVIDMRTRPRYDELLLEKYLGTTEGLIDRLERGITVLDAGCGTGYCANLIAKNFPNSKIFGHDWSDESLDRAREEARSLGVSNVTFVKSDVSTLPDNPKYELILAFDAIHDQVDPARVLRNIRGALAPNGTFLMVDIDASSDLADNLKLPHGPFLYTLSMMHCMPVSLAYGGAGLGAVWGVQLATKMLREAGFQDVRVIREIDPMNALFIAA